MVHDFEEGLKFVLNAEGGYVDDPDDPGGATNLGIEQLEYNAWRHAVGKAPENIKNITRPEAAAIYKMHYWDVICGDDLLRPLALTLFDGGVNTGCGTALKELQTALRITTTGCFDDETRACYFAYKESGRSVAVLASDVLQMRVAYYHKIIAENPHLARFLDGWLARVRSLQAVINA